MWVGLEGCQHPQTGVQDVGIAQISLADNCPRLERLNQVHRVMPKAPKKSYIMGAIISRMSDVGGVPAAVKRSGRIRSLP